MTHRTTGLSRRTFNRLALAGLGAAVTSKAFASGFQFQEAPALAELAKQGKLPPLAERLPKSPLIADFARSGRKTGKYGGEARTLAARARDLRYISVNAYTRLVGFNDKLQLEPDLVLGFENVDERIFTFTLREGHRWSDGTPFTTADFRYFWEDIALNKELNPTGPPEVMIVDGKLPKVEFLDELTVRYSWDRPNPRFLPSLAQPRALTLYSPGSYLKQFHRKYRDKGELEQLAAKAKLKSWAALHNRMDDAYENANPAMPTLNAWRVVTPSPATRYIFERNAFFHRVDPEGRQLPYVDRIVVDIASASLFAAKANAGEVDLLARGISMNDIPVLKEGESAEKYTTLLWEYGRGSAYALYPNLNTNDPVWRTLNRDLRYRKALSAAIDRRIINNALLFGLGVEGNNTVLSSSPLYTDINRTLNAQYDPDLANKLLNEIGLTERDAVGIRKLPDGRLLEIIVEVDGEAADIVDALQLITEMWRDVGVKLFVKPQDRTILRQRSYSGLTVMVAAGGLDNALPTPEMPPTEIAPVRQDNYSWPKWGQWVETQGKNGEEPDIEAARKLIALYKGWLSTGNIEESARIWSEMLAIHAEQQFSIGTVAGEIQPIVVSTRMHNVPEKAVYSYDPTALMGIYRIEEFWFE
ncbi:MAG TPA: ABC transporter substrate-binding protein [Hyphomicrobium sp.]|nr:ABC transporter substrate-binding protein [Hyphomicrobium sp.]